MVGRGGLEKQRVVPVYGKLITQTNTTAGGADPGALRASEMGMEDMYGRQSNVQGGLYESEAFNDASLGSMNPMVDRNRDEAGVFTFDQADIHRVERVVF